MKREGRRRVLILVENLAVPFDRRVWREATALQSNGYEVTVICPKGWGYEKSSEVLDGIQIYRHPLYQADKSIGYLLEYVLALFWETVLSWRVFLTRGFDVIHACSPPDNLFLVAAPFKLLGKKFVFDHHDVSPELWEAKTGGRGFVHRALVWLERATFAMSDVSIATNESYKSVAVERGKMDPDDVFIVRSGPVLERFRILPPTPELKKGKAHLVGYVGVMAIQDGIEYLLRAAHEIVHERGRDDIHFGLVGGGPDFDRLQNLTKELELEDYVTFTGVIPDEDLLVMLNTADVCVNPDEYNQMNDMSTMNKIMEYMVLAKPIVQFDMTEGRFSALEASLYAAANDAQDMADKILELIDDPDRRRQMGELGRDRVINHLAWEHQVPPLLAAYDEVFDSGR